MELSYADGRTCSVCGSRITDANPDGIGVECRYSYKKAKASVFFDVKERSFEFYGIKTKMIMDLFIEEHKDVKFRSKFKKSFYPSVVEQWETKGYLSKKQLDICEDMLYQRVDYKTLSDITVEIGKFQQALIENWVPNQEEKVKIFNYANKFRHEFRRKNG